MSVGPPIRVVTYGASRASLAGDNMLPVWPYMPVVSYVASRASQAGGIMLLVCYLMPVGPPTLEGSKGIGQTKRNTLVLQVGP